MRIYTSFTISLVLKFLGALAFGNGLWMLVSAHYWFVWMPVAATDTGPENQHFIHDVGLVYVLTGIAAFWCAIHLKKAFSMYIAITCFLVGHSAIHMVEILLGQLPINHIWIDFPLITLPALLLLAMLPKIHSLQKSV